MIDFRAGVTAFARLRRRDQTIRFRIIALIAIMLVPLIGLSAYLAVQYAGAQKRVIEAQRHDVVNNLTFLLDSEIAGITGTLTALAVSPDLVNDDFQRFRRHAEAAVQQPNIRSIQVLDRAGKQIDTTMMSPDQPLPNQTDDGSVAAVFSGRTTVSSLFVSGADRPFFCVAVPVRRDGRVIYALEICIFTEQLAGLFCEAGIEPGWVAGIIDRNGLFLARSLSPELFVGRLSRPELGMAARGKVDVGEFENVTLEGVAMVNSFRRSSLSGWTSVVAVPSEMLTAPLRKTMTFVVLGGGIVSALSLAIASLMAARISEPVRMLSSAAVALVEGRALPEMPHQITELNEVRAAFEYAAAKSAHLAAIVASSGDAIVSTDRNGRVRSWNMGAERLFGYSAEQMIGQSWTLIVPVEQATEAARKLALVHSGESLRIETVRQTRDGTRINVSINAAPILGPSGAIIGMSSIAHDITERKAAEQHQRILMRELTHRSKNLLAVVQSIAGQTIRSADSLADFQSRFDKRLQGIAASHDLLVMQNWTGAPLNDLALRQLEIFVEDGRGNITLDGPDVRLSPDAAQSIGLALHELATNSMKYGALSIPTGKVEFSWGFEPNATEPRQLRLRWRERGGPPVVPPTRKGFGHFVINRLVSQSLEGKVQIDFPPDGFVWTLTIPTTQLLSEPGKSSPQSQEQTPV